MLMFFMEIYGATYCITRTFSSHLAESKQHHQPRNRFGFIDVWMFSIIIFAHHVVIQYMMFRLPVMDLVYMRLSDLYLMTSRTIKIIKNYFIQLASTIVTWFEALLGFRRELTRKRDFSFFPFLINYWPNLNRFVFQII